MHGVTHRALNVYHYNYYLLSSLLFFSSHGVMWNRMAHSLKLFITSLEKHYSSNCLLHQICASGSGLQIQTALFANKVFHKPTNTYSRIALPQFSQVSDVKSLALRVTSINLVSLETGSIVEYVFP